MTNEESSSPKGLQGWKLWLLASLVIISGLSFFYSDEIKNWFGVAGVLVQLGLLILTFTALAWVFYSIRCRHCGLRLVQYSMTNKSAGEWLQWVIEVKTCPSCGGADPRE